MHAAQVQDRNLMLDCGIKLGEKTEYPLLNDDELRRVQGITVSHAHLDHSGYLPHVYSKDAKPKIFMTKPTRDLIGICSPTTTGCTAVLGSRSSSSRPRMWIAR